MDKFSDEYITIKAAMDAAKRSRKELYPYGSREVPIDPAEEHLIGEAVARNPALGAKPFCDVCLHHHPAGSNHLD